MKTQRQAAFDALVSRLESRDDVKPKDIEALKDLATKNGALTDKGAARVRDFYDRFSAKMSKSERVTIQALLASSGKGSTLAPLASVRVEGGVSKNYPYVTVKGIVPDGSNTAAAFQIEKDKEGNLTVTVGAESKGKHRGPIKKPNEPFERELELWKHTDAVMFKVRFQDPFGNELRTLSFDTDD